MLSLASDRSGIILNNNITAGDTKTLNNQTLIAYLMAKDVLIILLFIAEQY